MKLSEYEVVLNETKTRMIRVPVKCRSVEVSKTDEIDKDGKPIRKIEIERECDLVNRELSSKGTTKTRVEKSPKGYSQIKDDALKRLLNPEPVSETERLNPAEKKKRSKARSKATEKRQREKQRAVETDPHTGKNQLNLYKDLMDQYRTMGRGIYEALDDVLDGMASSGSI